MLSIHYSFNPHHFMVPLSFHFIDEETEGELTCPRKLQTHDLALWLNCQKRVSILRGRASYFGCQGPLTFTSIEIMRQQRAMGRPPGCESKTQGPPWPSATPHWNKGSEPGPSKIECMMVCIWKPYTKALPHNVTYAWRQELRRYWRLNEVIG